MILGIGEIPKLILLSYDLGSMKQRKESTFYSTVYAVYYM